MTTPAKDGAGTCNGGPGKPGTVLGIGLTHIKDSQHDDKYLQPQRRPCPGCSACHPGDCIVCAKCRDDDGTFNAVPGRHIYHGPDCTNCGGSGIEDSSDPAVRFMGASENPCTTYIRPTP